MYRKYSRVASWRSTKSKSYEALIQFYQSSYKKLKFWFNLYYIILIVVTLTIPLNIEDWKLVFY